VSRNRSKGRCTRYSIAKGVKPITFLIGSMFTVNYLVARVDVMLLLSAIFRVWQPREPEPNDLLAEARQRIGHLGLTVIALVYVLLAFWQQ
jgi:hypothetical protein